MALASQFAIKERGNHEAFRGGRNKTKRVLCYANTTLDSPFYTVHTILHQCCAMLHVTLYIPYHTDTVLCSTHYTVYTVLCQYRTVLYRLYCTHYTMLQHHALDIILYVLCYNTMLCSTFYTVYAILILYYATICCTHYTVCYVIHTILYILYYAKQPMPDEQAVLNKRLWN